MRDDAGRQPKLNALGKPLGLHFDPRYRLPSNTARGVAIGRLSERYGPSMKFVGDTADSRSKRSRRAQRPRPAPLLDLLQSEPPTDVS